MKYTNPDIRQQRRNCRNPKSGHVRILPVSAITPSPENEKLYRPVSLDDPSVRGVAESIRTLGFSGPMIVSRDGFILSGHRRYAAAQLVGLNEVPCIVEKIDRVNKSGGLNPEFVKRLEMYNRQREKSLDEKLREAVVKADPDDAHRVLSEHRQARAIFDDSDVIELRGIKRRAKISGAKAPMMGSISHHWHGKGQARQDKTKLRGGYHAAELIETKLFCERCNVNITNGLLLPALRPAVNLPAISEKLSAR
jgi:hypothetical protein